MGEWGEGAQVGSGEPGEQIYDIDMTLLTQLQTLSEGQSCKAALINTYTPRQSSHHAFNPTCIHPRTEPGDGILILFLFSALPFSACGEGGDSFIDPDFLM